MKKSKRILSSILASVLACTALAGCASSTTEVSSGSSNTNSTAQNDDKYVVGICQLVEHVALDAATEGFKRALIEELGEDKIEFNFQNAQNDSATCATITNQFVSDKVDLIMANATPALQAAAAATGEIPILGTSVTEYGVALQIENFNGTVGGNISGTSDLAPLNEQAAMIKEWFPDAKTVGLLYCSAEANSQYQVDVIAEELKKLGINSEMYSFSDSNDLSAVCTNAADKSDVIYVPTDNTVASNVGIIDNICSTANVPVIAGEEGICAGCGVATLSISYDDLGYTTGKMAAKILKGEANIADMPVEYAPAIKKYNADVCDRLGIEPVEGYTAIEK